MLAMLSMIFSVKAVILSQEKIIRRSGIKIKIYGFYSTNTNRNTSTKQIALSSLSV